MDELRWGVMVSGTSLPRWQAEVVDALLAVEGARLVVVVRDAAPAAPRPSAGELWSQGRLAWTLFNRAAARRSVALRTVDCSDRFAGVPQVDVVVRAEGHWQEFPDDALGDVAAQRPDMLLRLGFGMVRGTVLDVAPLGIWSFHHDDERVVRGGPPCFWELAHGDPVSGVLLQRLTDRLDGGAPLARAAFATVPQSYRRNRDQSYLGAAGLPAQVARRVLADGPQVVEVAPSTSTAPLYRPPGWVALAKALVRMGAANVGRQADGIFRGDRWNVGVLDRPIASLLDDPDVSSVRWLPRLPEKERYVADPAGVMVGDDLLMLVEDYDHAGNHGVVSAIRWSAPAGSGAAPVSAPTEVGRFEHHASYPAVVEVAGEGEADGLWCLPENAGSGEVRAYRFDPTSLQLGRPDRSGDTLVLVAGLGVLDPTLVRWDGRWWLFGTDRDRGSNTSLRAWYAERFEGPWHPHACDPLVVDVNGARGAGTPFVHEGVLYRPVQRCSPRYGSAVGIFRVDRLDPDGYAQTEVAVISPDPDGPFPDGLHTISAVGGVTLVDGNVRRLSLPVVKRELRARFRR